MSKLRKKLGIDRVQIRRIFDFESLQDWLDKLTVILEDNYRLQRDVAQGSTAAETPNWFIRDATVADVTAGDAQSVGNLIVENKTTGTKHEFEV